MRIAFCGASGTGKTTLARWLVSSYDMELNPVGSRSVSKAMGFDSPYDVDKVGMRRQFQHRLQDSKVEWELDHDHFVTDRTTYDELVYAIMHDVSAIDERYLARAISHMRRYTHVIYCPAEEFINTGDDPARVKDFTYHVVFDTVLHGYLKRWQPERLITLHCEGIEERKRALKRSLGLL